MKICGIYKITNPKNKIYIGQSVSIKCRFRDYRRIQCKKQVRLYNSFQKYGYDNHVFEIIHVCEMADLNFFEKYYIELYNSFNSANGLNLRSGGDKSILTEAQKSAISNKLKGHIVSESTREKLRQHNIGKKASEETKNKMRGRVYTDEARYNISKAQKGKKISEEAKIKISNTLKGHSVSPETRDKLRKYNIGKTYSNETKKKLSQLLIGNKRMCGRTLSMETRDKMKASHIKRWKLKKQNL